MNKATELVLNAKDTLSKEFEKVDNICFINSQKVLDAFKNNNIMESDFAPSSGYGYNDIGRDKIEKVFAQVFKGEDALVRTQFVSGSHALCVCLFALLRPNDLLLSITGKPYDTLHEVIGIKENNSSLKSFGVKYDEIDLIHDDFDDDKIVDYLKNNKVKVIEIQRSRGYSLRKSLTIDKLERIIKKVKDVSKDTIIMVDNCYCEFVEEKSSLEVGADLIVGSLIKNLGGGIASCGGYIIGKKELVSLAGERLSLPGEGKEVGPSLGANKSILMGLYYAPSVVSSALKCAILTSKVLSSLGYEVSPKYDEQRCDIVQSIIFNNEKKLIDYCNGIQGASAIDSNASVIPTDMPGYSHKIVMASGSFTQGSSIEISCDGPIKAPYVCYQQGSLTLEYGILALINAISKII